ncbi:MAG TPA: hypothetical protein VLZ05_16750 [Mycobacterium sp.]|nr:hypothetical protein [Mycobacterium sp.]HUH70357.1 hypothetical protein [Mycobacterium sp.]
MGIVNIATTSDGQRAAAARLNRYRKRQQRLRARLQAKKTPSAPRLLKKRRCKEARVRLRKPQRATLHSWAFAQLGVLGYKAQAPGGVRRGGSRLQQSNLPCVRVGRQT